MNMNMQKNEKSDSCPKCKKGDLTKCRKNIWYRFISDYFLKNYTIKTYKCSNCHKITAMRVLVNPFSKNDHL